MLSCFGVMMFYLASQAQANAKSSASPSWEISALANASKELQKEPEILRTRRELRPMSMASQAFFRVLFVPSSSGSNANCAYSAVNKFLRRPISTSSPTSANGYSNSSSNYTRKSTGKATMIFYAPHTTGETDDGQTT